MSATNNIIPDNEFHLGITMAGAVSAGCYTGGVMDYLFEVLDLWERAKEGKLEKELKQYRHCVPNHKVIIDVMGGASAGGMTTTMAAIYGLNGRINPVTDTADPLVPRNNIFYDSWVLMDDINPHDDRTTIEKLWDTNDLKEGKVHSLLNSTFIDAIADRAFSFKEDIGLQTGLLPSYIARDMKLLLSHCLLRGIPLEVNFETPITGYGRKSISPNHTTLEHYIVSLFTLNNGKPPEDHSLWLNPYDPDYAETLKRATKATGAFPVGLIYREFLQEDFSDEYIKATVKKILFGEFGHPDPHPEANPQWKNFPAGFSALTIDGGTINNEPYREVLSILKDKYGDTHPEGQQQYGMIMIDPFPDRAEDISAYRKPADLVEVIPAIINTLTEQARVKRNEALEEMSRRYYRGVIFPRKWQKMKEGPDRILPEKNPIACGAAGAFGGFLDISFRQHDFFLGRDNARNFIRYFFTVPYDKEKNIVHPVHRGWTEEMIQQFKVIKKHRDKEGNITEKTFLPLIPDIHILLEKAAGKIPDPYTYTIAEKPVYNPARLFEMRNKMVDRTTLVLELIKSRKRTQVQDNHYPITASWSKKYHSFRWWHKIARALGHIGLNIAFSFTKKKMAGRIIETVIKWILRDLEKRALLPETR